MKYFVIALFVIGFATLFQLGSNAYGLWVPQPPQELLEQSQLIFVGNITSVESLDFEKSFTHRTSKDGIEQEVVENYTLTLDEYTVDVEEFVKNPQNFDNIKVRQPTISGSPGQLSAVSGFETGDRILFYLNKIDGENTYSPESFIIPKQCDAKSVLEETRIQGGNSFKIMQEGIEKSNNFTANKPIEFVYEKDVGTLSGKSLDILIHIAKKNVGKSIETTAFEKEIHAESNPCEWIASAEWEIIPEEGDYRMFVSVREDGSTDTSDTGFSVISDTATNSIMSPLKQFKSGIPSNEIQCKEGLEIALKSSDGSPACVTPETKIKLIERGWAKPV